MSKQPTSRGPLGLFTFAGRILLIVTLLAGGGLFAFVILYGEDRAPTGNYPLGLVLIPVVIGTAVFFVAMEFILRLIGIQVWSGQDQTTADMSEDGAGIVDFLPPRDD